MPLVAVPNVSEGRRTRWIEDAARTMGERGARVLDVHTDATHNRSVFTLTGESEQLAEALAGLARLASSIDLTQHAGVHPRLGGLDVCPIVPHETDMQAAVATARRTAERIVEVAGLPVYFYGAAATRSGTVELPGLRRGGLNRLIERARSGLAPDLGPSTIDPRTGVVCVGARDVLIAFNVWLAAPVTVAAHIAAEIRARDGGLPGVRSLGLRIDEDVSQVSMNLITPETTGIDAAFNEVAGRAALAGVEVMGTEIVGLVPQRFMPDPNAQAARLLMKPGRSLESALGG